jgi:hypothetical protein
MALFNRAIPVLISDTINIPQPGEYLSGASSTGTNTLTTVGAEFRGKYNPARTGYSDRVIEGDVVYVDSNATNRPEFITQVASIDSDTVLTLDPPVAGIAAPYNYKIYRSNGGGNNLTAGNPGYTLIGPFSTSTILNVIPAGQNSSVFIKPNDTADLGLEQILVQRVLETGSVDVTEYGLVALQPSDNS